MIDVNAKKWKFSEIRMIFTKKSASDAENQDLWKITKNAKTLCQIVRFGSFSDMLVLTTIKIKILVKFLKFLFFSEKSPIFGQNWPKSAFLAKIRPFIWLISTFCTTETLLALKWFWWKFITHDGTNLTSINYQSRLLSRIDRLSDHSMIRVTNPKSTLVLDSFNN